MTESDADRMEMSAEERLKLCDKLDKELDDFIGNLERTEYKDGWNEDTWEQELEKHPFFTQKVPQEGESLPPLIEGLQQLKFDPKENTSEELAENYKADGNYNFKLKKYRFAIANYTEGLKCKCPNKKLNAQIYNNRSAAHFHLGNYGFAIKDCQSALKLEQGYAHCLNRLIQCFLKLSRFKEAISWCDICMRLNPEDSKLVQLHLEAIAKQKAKERDERREAHLAKIKANENKHICDTIRQRKIQVANDLGDITVDFVVDDLMPKCPSSVFQAVHLTESNELVWPVMMLYPEYDQSDFVVEFNENSTFLSHLELMFSDEPPSWDVDEKYRVNALVVFFKCHSSGQLLEIDVNETLGKALTREGYVVAAGIPTFLVFVRNSRALEQALAHSNRT